MDQNQPQYANIPEGPEAEKFFADIRKRIQESETPKKELTPEEDRKMQDGFAIEEMTHGAGWAIVADILSHMPMAHIDPRGMNEEDWKFAELNAFYQGQVAKELMDAIYSLIQEAHELQKKKLGEVRGPQKMRF
jgi:hypothetical protein